MRLLFHVVLALLLALIRAAALPYPPSTNTTTSLFLGFNTTDTIAISASNSYDGASYAIHGPSSLSKRDISRKTATTIIASLRGFIALSFLLYLTHPYHRLLLLSILDALDLVLWYIETGLIYTFEFVVYWIKIGVWHGIHWPYNKMMCVVDRYRKYKERRARREDGEQEVDMEEVEGVRRLEAVHLVPAGDV